MTNADVDWIPAGQAFRFEDLVFWQGKGGAPFDAAAARIDTVVLGPHASARFPGELRPFVDGALTRRSSTITPTRSPATWAAPGPPPTPRSSSSRARIRALRRTPIARRPPT